MWRIGPRFLLHSVPMTAPRKPQVAREAWWLRSTPLRRLSTSKQRLQRLKICKTFNPRHQLPAYKCGRGQQNEGRSDEYRLWYVPCRQIGHELDSSSNQGSTQAWWKTCLPSHGNTRTSSPSSKSMMQIGHVSRPIDSGIGSTSADVALDGSARMRGRGTAVTSLW